MKFDYERLTYDYEGDTRFAMFRVHRVVLDKLREYDIDFPDGFDEIDRVIDRYLKSPSSDRMNMKRWLNTTKINQHQKYLSDYRAGTWALLLFIYSVEQTVLSGQMVQSVMEKLGQSINILMFADLRKSVFSDKFAGIDPMEKEEGHHIIYHIFSDALKVSP